MDDVTIKSLQQLIQLKIGTELEWLNKFSNFAWFFVIRPNRDTSNNYLLIFLNDFEKWAWWFGRAIQSSAMSKSITSTPIQELVMGNVGTLCNQKPHFLVNWPCSDLVNYRSVCFSKLIIGERFYERVFVLSIHNDASNFVYQEVLKAENSLWLVFKAFAMLLYQTLLNNYLVFFTL